jgi:hypothetical protein
MGEIEIDQAFIDYREQMKWKFHQGNRTDEQFTMCRDCLIIEYSMIQFALASPSYDKAYDIGLGVYNALVDIKVVSGDYWNITKYDNMTDKKEWYVGNVEKGLLTHYAFYRYKVKPTRPLIVGDKVSFNLIEVSTARQVLSNTVPSIRNPGGWYYEVKK